MSSIASRHIVVGASALCLLALAAPLSAQQPARQQADTSCAVAEAGQIAMRDTTLGKSDKAMGRSVDSAAVSASKNKTQDGQAVAECRNQTQSGVTDSAGASTLGPGVKKATPDQDQPVTSKGDTLRKPGDSYQRDTTSGYKRDSTNAPK